MRRLVTPWCVYDHYSGNHTIHYISIYIRALSLRKWSERSATRHGNRKQLDCPSQRFAIFRRSNPDHAWRPFHIYSVTLERLKNGNDVREHWIGSRDVMLPPFQILTQGMVLT